MAVATMRNPVSANGRPRATLRTIAELKAANYEIIAESWLSALTISILTERTGYSTAIENYHFGSKAKFLRRLLDHAFSDAQHSIEASFLNSNTLSGFRSLFARVLTLSKVSRHTLLVYQNLLNGGLGADRELTELVRRHNDWIKNMIAGRIRQEQEHGVVRVSTDADATAMAVHGATRGIVSLALTGECSGLAAALATLEHWLEAAFKAI